MYGEFVPPNGISSSADFRPEHQRFERVRPSRRWTELEKSEPPFVTLAEVFSWIGLVLFMFAAFAIPSIIVWLRG